MASKRERKRSITLRDIQDTVRKRGEKAVQNSIFDGKVPTWVYLISPKMRIANCERKTIEQTNKCNKKNKDEKTSIQTPEEEKTNEKHLYKHIQQANRPQD